MLERQNVMRYKLILFDFDGTLADSLPWFAQTINLAAARYRFKPVDVANLDLLRGYSARQLVRHLGVSWWKIPFIARYLRGRMADEAALIAPFRGVPHMLEQLAQAGITLALVTSNAQATAARVLGEETFARFTFVECDVALFGKRARFRKILKQSGIAPHDALAIGDEIRDHEAAMQEKIAFGAVAWGYTTLAALQARHPAMSFAQVEEIVDQLMPPN